ncbi:MAG: hypothetical protein MZU84_05935 [Sphingobacterium sp.]|nr:hypothetical protein [Sphingobacterium sp.]
MRRGEAGSGSGSCQCHGSPGQMLSEIDRSVEAGAKAVFIQGARVEEQFGKGRFDTLRDLDRAHPESGAAGGRGPPTGPRSIRSSSGRDFPTDFYYQCLYNASKSSDYSAAEREQAAATIARIRKPVVAYKILAAGRLTAAEGFEYAFNHIKRKDGVCVGIYAKNAVDQIRQNATYTKC